jgi:hypothetical protein
MCVRTRTHSPVLSRRASQLANEQTADR